MNLFPPSIGTWVIVVAAFLFAAWFPIRPTGGRRRD
jgi:hypothetical protein